MWGWGVCARVRVRVRVCVRKRHGSNSTHRLRLCTCDVLPRVTVFALHGDIKIAAAAVSATKVGVAVFAQIHSSVMHPPFEALADTIPAIIETVLHTKSCVTVRAVNGAASVCNKCVLCAGKRTRDVPLSADIGQHNALCGHDCEQQLSCACQQQFGQQ